MSKTFNGSIDFTSNFNVQTTKPLDNRLVVDSYDDLTNGSIEAPYQGMVVNIAGTSELWILKTSGIAESRVRSNWELVTGTGTGSGSGLSKYSLPVMTPEMVEEASADSDIDFDESETPHILVEYDPLNTLEAQGDVYFGLIQDMVRSIKALQAEVARLKNSFEYGIDSYKNTRTAKSTILYEMGDVDSDEPLWAIDTLGLSLVPDGVAFNTILDVNHTFTKIGAGTIDVSVEGQLTFDECKGVFSDGDEHGEDLTLYALDDSKLITYLVTDKPDVKLTLVSLTDKTRTREIELAPILEGNSVGKYGFCIVISRKDKVTLKGSNYIYFSIINYNNDRKLCEGYLTSNGTLSDTKVEVDDRYAIQSLEFDRLTLSRMKFYTKFEDFSEEVIPSAPSEDDYKYEVAHIAIRSVENMEMLNAVANQLRDNELIWNKKSGTLHIKSDGKIHRIGSNSIIPDDDNNNDNNMTDREILAALEKMGIVVNVEYKKDGTGEETDEILSVSDMSLAPISDVTFINNETGKKFTFTVDTEGNLVGKDNSATTIEEFMESLGTKAGNYDETDYKAVRGFISDYLFRKEDITNLVDGVNSTGDAGKRSDRLRISSFYAPITTDVAHGCTHSFIELENTSNVDIPLEGIYLHFFNPSENEYDNEGNLTTNIVHHLALDGVCKAGSTYLIRGAKHAEFDDESAFIKVNSFDKEWYEDGVPISFEQKPVKTTKVTDSEGTTTEVVADDSEIKNAYRFCLTYGLPNLSASEKLVERNTNMEGATIGSKSTYDAPTYPNIIVNPRFIDSCSYSTFASVSAQTGTKDNPWYANGDSTGIGITITENSMFRLMFALDPAKQAFNGFNTKDSSRVRYNKATDIQVLKLDKEFIGYPNSNEIINIDRYTPKASYENKNVMTDKSQLDREKPNMVTCSFGTDVYNTRCFNWISCGAFDEYVWIRKEGDTAWTKFQSYVKVTVPAENPEADSFTTVTVSKMTRKEYSPLVNNAVYARMINRFPGNNVLFTSHKCVVILPDASSTPVKYEYVVGRPDKDGNPDLEHTNSIYNFTIYPRTYEGRVYQITDQQGFHWIEYQVWAASAEFLNTKITGECNAINGMVGKTKVFPILLNTGDMTQSGARINEWLDYYNGGVSLFNHLEQMNCVGNNDLCPINPNELGTGNDSDKSSSHFFHYFYCFDVKDTAKFVSVNADKKKFFSGESLVVRKHTGTIGSGDSATNINIKEDRYIPSFYYFKTNKVLYIIVNSEIPISNVQKWFGLCSTGNKYVNIYTGIEIDGNGNYAGDNGYFTPLYESMYAWLKDNQDETNSKTVIVAMHEMPFTVITKASLANDSNKQIPCTRNHPTGAGRLGSNVNQLNIDEKKGIYWCSRLLEFFNCKLVLGGHKHTYALSYPIKENYSWTYNGVTKNSSEQIKPMFSTLADEANGGDYNVSWDIDLTTENRNEYNIVTDTTKVGTDTKLNSTKTPYIPEHLYNDYGKDAYENSNSGLFRCCTPLTVNTTDSSGENYNPDYNGFVTYSMCQATGYKLKSNKELPSMIQVFSKIIPLTTHGTNKVTGQAEDKPSGEQLYPMYSILEFNNDCSEVFVSMNRITNIFKANGKDAFTQSDFGKNKPARQMLCTYEKEDCTASGPIANRTGTNDGDTYFATDENKMYKYTQTDDGFVWNILRERMYGKWLSESQAMTRMEDYEDNPTNVSDNRYLHIKF